MFDYDNSPHKQVGRDLILALYKEYVYHKVNNRPEIRFLGLPAYEWSFEQQLAEILKDSTKKFRYYACERDSQVFWHCIGESYQSAKLGGKDAYDRLNVHYFSGDVFDYLYPSNVIYLDLCGGFTAKNLRQLKRYFDLHGVTTDLLFITFDRKWRYRRYAPEEIALYTDLYNTMSIVDANSQIIRRVLPKYISTAQPILSYEYSNRSENNMSTPMITLGYNFSNIPLTNKFFGDYVDACIDTSWKARAVEPVRDSIDERIASDILVGAATV